MTKRKGHPKLFAKKLSRPPFTSRAKCDILYGVDATKGMIDENQGCQDDLLFEN